VDEVDRDAEDLRACAARLTTALGKETGKLRVSDALRLAGFEQSSFQRMRLVAQALTSLGWTRCRLRFNGVLVYAYARGSKLERETILDAVLGDDGQLIVKRRDP
jgi:hypothetical protein